MPQAAWCAKKKKKKNLVFWGRDANKYENSIEVSFLHLFPLIFEEHLQRSSPLKKEEFDNQSDFVLNYAFIEPFIILY